jgi:hypothetical protein
MSINIFGLLTNFAKIPLIDSIDISGIKNSRITKILAVIWIGAVLIVWLKASIFNSQPVVAEIPFSVLILIVALLGADIGLNFGEKVPTTSPSQQSSPSSPNQVLPDAVNQNSQQMPEPFVHPDLSNQQPRGEKD